MEAIRSKAGAKRQDYRQATTAVSGALVDGRRLEATRAHRHAYRHLTETPLPLVTLSWRPIFPIRHQGKKESSAAAIPLAGRSSYSNNRYRADLRSGTAEIRPAVHDGSPQSLPQAAPRHRRRKCAVGAENLRCPFRILPDESPIPGSSAAAVFFQRSRIRGLDGRLRLQSA